MAQGVAEHPANRRLVEWLQPLGVPVGRAAYSLDGYELHTHPDLVEHLASLSGRVGAELRGLFGMPVLVDPASDVVYAVATGTSGLGLRLPPAERDGRSSDVRGHGEIVRRLGDEWLALDAWETAARIGSDSRVEELLRRARAAAEPM